MSGKRRGRSPGGRTWGPEQERLHPRDDRGRFSRKGGSRWAARVVKGFEAGFGDTSMAQGRDPRTAGRAPGGVIDLGGLAKRGREAGEHRKLIEQAREIVGTPTHIRDVQIGDQIKADDEWRTVTSTGSRNGVSYIGWRDAQGVQRNEISEADKPTVFIRREPKYEAGRALKAGGEQERRMDAWRADARHEPPFRFLTKREAELRSRKNEIAAAEVALSEATRKAKARARRKYPEKEGYGKYTRDEYVDRETWTEQHAVEMAKASLDYLRNAELSKYDTQPDSYTPAEMVGEPDRSRPLALYGDMLHALAYDEVSFRSLAELEALPFELHQIVAGAMARKRYEFANGQRYEAKGNPGIYVGNASTAELLPEYFAGKDETPRGWDEGSTFHDVHGVFAPKIFAVVVGSTAASEHANDSAAEHEFGHALDKALASKETGYQVASLAPEFQALHDRVLANHGPRLSPYYQQPGEGGRSEFFAEAFATWVSAYRKTLATERTSDVKSINPDAFYANRTAVALKREFDITDPSTLDDLHSYFLKLSAGAGVRWE